MPKSIKLIKLEESRFQGQIAAYALCLPLAIQFCHYKSIKMISQLSYFIHLRSNPPTKVIPVPLPSWTHPSIFLGSCPFHPPHLGNEMLPPKSKSCARQLQYRHIISCSTCYIYSDCLFSIPK